MDRRLRTEIPCIYLFLLTSLSLRISPEAYDPRTTFTAAIARFSILRTDSGHVTVCVSHKNAAPPQQGSESSLESFGGTQALQLSAGAGK
ncbi:uncharacterized protein SCHCODRAFT_02622424 [Schizophyllum commune H4-8]|uniref:uncharacterized protein n=1 Tax=Schizophyllum commune (strain H4-8 / FGSC 9210) TaxID=578458 RepID=UPI00215FE8DA|nr:uncharacterized protein SCHCODRAFT_02622424 [Schizophyllum commune H4-8]KAI5893662.1 hypothetical protein SCHCODRAFT_02622424 [Schizophyllum commune H4-8]